MKYNANEHDGFDVRDFFDIVCEAEIGVGIFCGFRKGVAFFAACSKDLEFCHSRVCVPPRVRQGTKSFVDRWSRLHVKSKYFLTSPWAPP